MSLHERARAIAQQIFDEVYAETLQEIVSGLMPVQRVRSYVRRVEYGSVVQVIRATLATGPKTTGEIRVAVRHVIDERAHRTHARLAGMRDVERLILDDGRKMWRLKEVAR